MPAITASMVKELREKSGAGMMDCKKILVQTEGDIEVALIKLREKGLAAAAKKAGRIAAEGLVGIAVSDGMAAMAEVNCETDFVAKNADFQGLVEGLAKQALGVKEGSFADGIGQDGAALSEEAYVGDSSHTVAEIITSKVATIGEKITFRRFVKMTGGLFGSYKHGGGSIGAIVCVQAEDASKSSDPSILAMAKDIAMHVAATAPLALTRDEVAADIVAREEGIFTKQVVDDGKPEAIVPKIVAGKMSRFFKESCLLDQVFVKDNDLTISKLLEKVGKEVGTKLTVTGFTRFKVGEGIEKKSEDFAEEVARMAN